MSKKATVGRGDQAKLLALVLADTPPIGDKVIDERCPELIVTPVRIKPEPNIAAGYAGEADQPIAAAWLVLEPGRCGTCTLRITPGTIGIRREIVVDCEGVVAVVDVDIKTGQLESQGVAEAVVVSNLQIALITAVGIIAAKKRIVSKAVGFVLICAQADSRPFAEWRLDGNTHSARIIFGSQQTNIGRSRGTRASALYAYQTGDGVSTVARPLRATQDVDSLDIPGQRHTTDSREVDTVDQEAD